MTLLAEIVQIGAFVSVVVMSVVWVINFFVCLRRMKNEPYTPLYSDIIADLLAEKEKLEREHNITINFDAEETEDPYAKLEDTNENE